MSSRTLRPAISLLLAMTLLLGVIYPLAITAVAQVAFSRQASGSLVYRDGAIVGSELIGQQFSASKYLWGRPSATTPQPYNGLASSGSNLGPLNSALLDQVKTNAAALRQADPRNVGPVPVDLVTASASGLDPDISVAGARFQVARIARARGITPGSIETLIRTHEQGPFLGFVGERRINVLEFNLALDALP